MGEKEFVKLWNTLEDLIEAGASASHTKITCPSFVRAKSLKCLLRVQPTEVILVFTFCTGPSGLSTRVKSSRIVLGITPCISIIELGVPRRDFYESIFFCENLSFKFSNRAARLVKNGLNYKKAMMGIERFSRDWLNSRDSLVTFPFQVCSTMKVVFFWTDQYRDRSDNVTNKNGEVLADRIRRKRNGAAYSKLLSVHGDSFRDLAILSR